MKALDCVGVALLFGGAAVNAHAGCEQPPLVLIPAAEDLAGDENQVAEDTEAYFVAMQEYVNCIRAEIDSAGDDASELYLRVLVTRNNLAVGEAEAVQRWFSSRFPNASTPTPQSAPPPSVEN